MVPASGSGFLIGHKYKSLASIKSAKIHLSKTGKLPDNFLAEVKQLLCPWLDSQYGHTVQDKSIFLDFAKKWEVEFLSDMKKLNVCRRCAPAMP